MPGLSIASLPPPFYTIETMGIHPRSPHRGFAAGIHANASPRVKIEDGSGFFLSQAEQ
jgi:hypothetical protein